MGRLLTIFALGFFYATVTLAAADRFDFQRDVLAFSNDTFFSYGVDEAGRLLVHRRAKPVEYSHRCFVLCRAVMQFHQFARFDPKLPRVSEERYRRLVKNICRIPVWWTPFSPARAVVIPGYRDLHDFSSAHEQMLKEELGNWLPSYMRIGNWRMAIVFPRLGQAWAAGHLTDALDRGKLQAVYLARKLHMNHCVVLFDYHCLENGDIRFDLYDPNYPKAKRWLLYKPSERSFDFQRTWFFPGGRVNVMRVFISPVH